MGKSNSKALFSRGINCAFVQALKDLASGEGKFWQEIRDDTTLFVGIRDEYLNVYCHGISIAKLIHSGSKVRGTTHRAFLDDNPPDKPTYWPSFGTEGFDMTVESVRCRAMKHYKINTGDAHNEKPSSREKSAIQQLLEKTPNVIDLEVAVSMKRDKNLRDELNLSREIPRIDMVQLTNDPSGSETLFLTFIEIKHISNSDLVSTTTPTVVNQMEDYQKLLTCPQFKHLAERSYRRVCQNLIALGLKRYTVPSAALTREAAKRPETVKVDPVPQLLVIGDERDRSNWREGRNGGEGHRDKLKRMLTDAGCELR